MSGTNVFLLAAAAVFGIGAYGLLTEYQIVRKLLALNLMGSAVFLLLVALDRGQAADPVPQALVLTGIVVAVSATAFALALLVRMYRETGEASLDEPPDDGD